MARFSRFLVGGVVGAGLALLFSPKSGREIRNMLMGGGRKALPAADVQSYAPAGGEPAVTATPAAIDLESQIEVTRLEVETELEEAIRAEPEAEVEPAPQEAPAQEETAAKEEAPADLEVVEEEEAAAVEDIVAPEETPAAEVAEVEEQVAEEPRVAEEAPVSAPEEAPPDWEVLKTPAEGEPTVEGGASLEAELTVSAEAGESARPTPSGIDREEMRRRIDETRARLKAKAFDAMVSGETFIDETGAEKARAHREDSASPGVEKEVEEKIDESLREQD